MAAPDGQARGVLGRRGWWAAAHMEVCSFGKDRFLGMVRMAHTAREIRRWGREAEEPRQPAIQSRGGPGSRQAAGGQCTPSHKHVPVSPPGSAPALPRVHLAQ